MQWDSTNEDTGIYYVSKYITYIYIHIISWSIYICSYISIHLHLFTYIYSYISIHIYLSICIYSYIYHIMIHIHLFIYIHSYISIHRYLFIDIYSYIYLSYHDSYISIHTHDASIRFETQMNMFCWVHEEMGMEGGGRVGRGKFQGVELVEAGKGGCTMLVTRMIMMMMAPLRHRMGGGGYLQH